MQKRLAYISGSIVTLLFIFVVAYHVYTEIIIKNKFWIDLKKFILKSKTMIWDTATVTVHRQVAAFKSASSYTTSVVEAPQDKMKHVSSAEMDLRELLLESGDGPTFL